MRRAAPFQWSGRPVGETPHNPGWNPGTGALTKREPPIRMGFDKNDPRPIMQPAKKETKINIGMVVGVIVFFIIGGIAIGYMKYWHG